MLRILIYITHIFSNWLLLLIIASKFWNLIWLTLFYLLAASNWLLLRNIWSRNIEIVMMVQITASRLIYCLIRWLVCSNIMLKTLDRMSTLKVSTSRITTGSYSIFTNRSSLTLLQLIFTRTRSRIFSTLVNILIVLTKRTKWHVTLSDY